MTRVLVVAPSWVGDAVLAQPLFMRLHERIPNLELDVLAPGWTLPLFKRMPEVSGTIANPFDHGDLKLLARRKLGRQLAARHYQRALVLPNSFKSALMPWFAGIRSVSAYRGEKRGWIVSDCRDLDETALPLMAERFAWLAQPGSAALERPIPKPKLTIDHASRARTLAKLGLDTGRPVVAFCPGAEYGSAKRWPVRHFASLALTLSQQGNQIWLLGSAKDAAVTAAIRRESGHCCVDLGGKTSLDEAIDLLSLAHHVVTNDSGLMHVACAVGVAVTALYGSSSPGYTPPLSDKAGTIWLKLDCSPCFKRECPLGHFNCMNELTPEMVLAAINARAA
jgi:heptosyltransferase-2